MKTKLLYFFILFLLKFASFANALPFDTKVSNTIIVNDSLIKPIRLFNSNISVKNTSDIFTSTVGKIAEKKISGANKVAATYCSSYGNMDYQTSITSVAFNTINNTSGKPSGYSDYTALSTDATVGVSYPLNVKVNTDGNYTIYARAWIDWNGNGNFNDPGEAFNLGTVTNQTNGLTSISPSITIPVSASNGIVKMRISCKWNAYPTSCDTNFDFDGEVEDYLINVSPKIDTGVIAGSPFCAGSPVSVPYTISGTFNTGNNFTAQLSNASGSFATPITIGILTATTSGSISATIPTGTSTGSGYRIRVIGNNPLVTGAANGSNLTVNTLPGIPTATGGLICIGSTATLSASGANAGDRYKWYDAASAGTLLKTSSNNTENTYVTAVISATKNYWVAIINSNGCESGRTLVTATYPANSLDSQTTEGLNTWIGHVYDGTNTGVLYTGNFTNYFGAQTETELFDESYGGSTNCYSIASSLGNRSIYTETFSVRYRMKSSKKGLYVVDLGSDDGTRLAIDGTLVYNNWSDQSFSTKSRVLMSLTGTSSLVYDFYENGGGNRVVFNNLTRALSNTLDTNTTQNICLGSAAVAISGDVYGTLPVGVTLSGTGYQWAYGTNSSGPWTDISGATSATFTPNTASAPFNSPGTYYVIRKAKLSSTNNVSPNPYVVTNVSNAATIVINDKPATPGSITGTATQCPSLTSQVYSISAVTNATNYNWNVPTGWTVTAGSGTTSITVTTGTAGQNGNITVTAQNSCGTSAAATLAVTVNPGTPSTPSTISGIATQCPSLTSQVYSISAVTNATSYNWAVPTGWSVTAGAGTTSITVTTGTAGQNGNITVTAQNLCGTSSAATLAVTVTAIPTISGTTPGSRIGPGTVVLGATASSGTVNWYAASTGGTSLGTGTSFTTPSIATTITYWVDAIENGCTTSSRTPVIATIFVPVAIAGNQNIVCQNEAIMYSVTNTFDTYQWTVVGGTPSNGTESTINVTWGTGNRGYITVEGFIGGVSQGLDTREIYISQESVYTPSQSVNILAGQSTTISPQFTNKSLSFNGTSDYVGISNSNLINLNITDYRTVSLWFKANDVSSRQVLYNEGGSVNGFSMYIEGGNVKVFDWEDSIVWNAASAPIVADQWYYLTFVFDKDATDGYHFKGYLDGVEIGKFNQGANASDGVNAHSGAVELGANATNTIRFANNDVTSGNYFNGFLDEFKLWNRALTQNEIIAEQYHWLETPIIDSGLDVYFNFDNSVLDLASLPSAEDGALYGSPFYVEDSPLLPNIIWNTGATTPSITVSPGTSTTYSYTITSEKMASCYSGAGTVDVTVTIPPDNDGDGVYDVYDLDNDNDGITDAMENNCTPVIGYDAYWPLDNSKNDVSGNNYNSQTGSNVSFSTDSKKGTTSASFNGSLNYLRYSNGTFLNRAITYFSYSFWIKPSTLSGIQTLLDEGGGTNGITIRLNGNILENAIREGGAGSQVSTSSFIFPNDGLWHHIAFTYDNGNVIMYLDGVPSNILNTGFGQLAAHGSNQSFGRSDGDSFGFGIGNYYSGLMDEIVHYPSVMSQVDITNLFTDFCDNDGDGIPNKFDTDSDGDGCFDTNEAYGAVVDTNGDGTFGGVVGASQVDANGLVVGASYGIPATTAGGKYKFNEGVAVAITTPPSNQNVCENSDVTFSAIATATILPTIPITTTSTAISYQWQVSTNGGTNFTDIFGQNGTLASGAVVTLTLNNVLAGMNNNIYKVIFTNEANLCGAEVTALLTVNSCINYWKGNVSSNWNDPSNWTSNTVPAVDEDIIFDDVPLNNLVLDQNRSVNNITNAQATYILALTNGFKLSVKGDLLFTNGAKINAAPNNSSMEFAGAVSQSIPAESFVNDQVFNLVINNGNNVLLNGVFKLLNNLTVTSGKLDAISNLPTFIYTGAAIQSIESNQFLNKSIYNLTVDNTAGVNLNTNFSISNSLLINSGRKFLINPSIGLTVNGTINNASNSGLTLKSDATGTASLIHNTNNVPATVERYISGAAEDWHFLSSPISDQAIAGSSWVPTGNYGNGTGYDLYVWDEPTPCWAYQLNTSPSTVDNINWPEAHVIPNTTTEATNFIPGRGYLYSVEAANPTKEFAGNLNNGTVTYPITTTPTVDGTLRGFNLVGNPYPSSIDWQATSGWTRSNLLDSGGGKDMWIWNPTANNYGVFNSFTSVGTNAATQYIAPMQGFFVRATTNGNLGFDNAIRVHTGASNWFKPSKTKNKSYEKPQNIKVKIASQSGLGSDEVLLLFGASSNQAGAAKLYSTVKIAPSAYLILGKEELSVRYLTNTTDNPSVLLAFKPGSDGNYTLSIDFDNADYAFVILEDKKTKTIYNLLETPNYQFKASLNDAADRFVLHFTPKDSISEDNLSASIYYDGNDIILDLTLVPEQTEVKIYDMLGRIILHKTVIGNTIHHLPISIKGQVYIVLAKSENQSISKKVLVY